MSETSQPSIDQGPLKLNAVGRWEIRGGMTGCLHEISSGDEIYVKADDTWKLTRIEFDHASRSYVSVDGYHLADGVFAALPTA